MLGKKVVWTKEEPEDEEDEEERGSQEWMRE